MLASEKEYTIPSEGEATKKQVLNTILATTCFVNRRRDPFNTSRSKSKLKGKKFCGRTGIAYAVSDTLKIKSLILFPKQSIMFEYSVLIMLV